jgi:hypothetical protein
LNRNGKKITLSIRAETRSELVKQLGGRFFNFGDNETFDVNQVCAEKETESHLNAVVGGVLGGLVGVLAGPAGVVIGLGIGGALGNSKDEIEKNKIDNFNRNQL